MARSQWRSREGTRTSSVERLGRDALPLPVSSSIPRSGVLEVPPRAVADAPPPSFLLSSPTFLPLGLSSWTRLLFLALRVERLVGSPPFRALERGPSRSRRAARLARARPASAGRSAEERGPGCAKVRGADEYTCAPKDGSPERLGRASDAPDSREDPSRRTLAEKASRGRSPGREGIERRARISSLYFSRSIVFFFPRRIDTRDKVIFAQNEASRLKSGNAFDFAARYSYFSLPPFRASGARYRESGTDVRVTGRGFDLDASTLNLDVARCRERTTSGLDAAEPVAFPFPEGGADRPVTCSVR
ncbi:hypothetical protein KM043_001780 [Ampulex compressa]|nr:hypothetical protein KM043_001780 [Ampulex compressa]